MCDKEEKDMNATIQKEKEPEVFESIKRLKASMRKIQKEKGFTLEEAREAMGLKRYDK